MTQCEQVLKYIQDNGGITSMQAFAELGITRLSGRIFDLRQSGVKIQRTMVSTINRYGESTRYALYTREDV